MTRQYPLPLPHGEALGADNYLVTASNQLAMGWVERWPDWPAPCLVVYGPAGSGKTHLAHVWLGRSGGKVLTAKALVATPAVQLAVDSRAWLLDDAHRLAGDAEAEEALFHLYNALKEAQGTLLLTAAVPVMQWPIALPDLRSRLMAAAAVAIEPPDDALISGLLIKQFSDRQIDIDKTVVDYLLPRVTRTPSAIRELVEKLDRASLAEKRNISISLARQILEETTVSLF